MADHILTQEELKRTLKYNTATGEFIRVKNGKIAGSKHKSGYIRIKITAKKSYLAHRLAWLYVYGEMPTKLVDHINGDGYDNRIENLRQATNAENLQNMRNATSRSQSKFLGVSPIKSNGKYEANLRLNYEKFYLGSFDTPEEAHKAYIKAKRQKHNFCTL